MRQQQYAGQLELATQIKPETPPPQPKPTRPQPRDDAFPKWVQELKAKLDGMFATGYWYCADCDHSTERVESDNGQPATCLLCGSVRIEWKKPICVGDTQLLQPGDLS